MIAWSITIITLLVGIFYKFKQDKNKIGGKIAWCKSLWLSYTITAWFLLPPVFYRQDIGPLKNILLAFSLSFWIRGIIELLMLFKWKNWKPIYGITHNIFTFLLSLSLYFLNSSSLDNYSFVFMTSYFVGLILEIYYAHFFHVHVGKGTQGDEAVWFANKQDPKFKIVLRITTLGNLYVYSCLFYFLLNQ